MLGNNKTILWDGMPFRQIRLSIFPSFQTFAQCPLSICGRPLRRKWVNEGGTKSDAAICPACLIGGAAVARMGVRGPEPHHPKRALAARWKALVLPAPSHRLLCHTLLCPLRAFRRPLARRGLRRGRDRSP